MSAAFDISLFNFKLTLARNCFMTTPLAYYWTSWSFDECLKG